MRLAVLFLHFSRMLAFYREPSLLKINNRKRLKINIYYERSKSPMSEHLLLGACSASMVGELRGTIKSLVTEAYLVTGKVKGKTYGESD